jgi:chromosome segregation ATPase
MGKGEKVPHNSPTHSSNEYSSCDENDDELANNMIKKFGKSADSQIIKLIHKLEKQEACIESQGELLLTKREKNLGLEACLSKEREKVEKLNIELSLAKYSYERLTKEHSLLNDSIASLKNEHSLVQESLTSLKDKYHTLELNYDTL